MESFINPGEIGKDSILHRKRYKNKFLVSSKWIRWLDGAATSNLASIYIELIFSMKSAKLMGLGCTNCIVRISTSTKNRGDDGIESEYVLLLKLRTEQF